MFRVGKTQELWGEAAGDMRGTRDMKTIGGSLPAPPPRSMKPNCRAPAPRYLVTRLKTTATGLPMAAAVSHAWISAYWVWAFGLRT